MLFDSKTNRTHTSGIRLSATQRTHEGTQGPSARKIRSEVRSIIRMPSIGVKPSSGNDWDYDNPGGAGPHICTAPQLVGRYPHSFHRALQTWTKSHPELLEINLKRRPRDILVVRHESEAAGFRKPANLKAVRESQPARGRQWRLCGKMAGGLSLHARPSRRVLHRTR